jgi:hypothetical protein
LCKTLCLCITRFLCKTALCGKDGFDAKTSVLFKPWFNLNQSMCVNFWKMFGTKASGSSVGYKKRSIPMANTSKKRKQPSK